MFITSQSSFDPYELGALDRFYTPASLADRLVEHCDLVSVRSVADFAAGAGSLLNSAQKRWPSATLYANDIDRSAKALNNPAIAHQTNQNFLSEHFQLEGYQGGFDLVILNPPFSQPPARQGFSKNCSRALSFVTKSLRYLNDGGQVIALLPSIVLTSVQDRAALASLHSEFSVQVIVPPTRRMFAEADVSVCALKITRHKASIGQALTIDPSPVQLPWKVGRGRLSIPRASRMEAVDGWVHTTSLTGNRVAHRYVFPSRSSNFERCPKGAILLPRVGKFTSDKLVLLADDVDEAISDCIIWVRASDWRATQLLYDGLIANFHDLRNMYCGTGAGFITYQRLNRVLCSIGN